ncbi:hypothetical protein QR680_019091 [Steinernema hermaphroditum]|uniref:F-box domain-containing protein n=1 Tax=Steinernema hermaphroditum TaxID=289476 RepID=A0AA39HL82_9BILA|nr:hypothetical protein QR680_019091 [Steinernema hermaphroditum]
MESLPSEFIDSLLFILDCRALFCLARSLKNSVWRGFAEVHERERNYYSIDLWMAEETVYCGFSLNYPQRGYVDVGVLQNIQCRFLHFSGLCDCGRDRRPDDQFLLKFGQEEMPQLEKLILRHFSFGMDLLRS